MTKGTQVSTTVTLNNVGATTVSLLGLDMVGANSADFNVYGNPCGSSIGAGQTCTFNVYFDPSKTGAESAALRLFDSSPGSPHSLPLSGTGQ